MSTQARDEAGNTPCNPLALGFRFRARVCSGTTWLIETSSTWVNFARPEPACAAPLCLYVRSQEETTKRSVYQVPTYISEKSFSQGAHRTSSIFSVDNQQKWPLVLPSLSTPLRERPPGLWLCPRFSPLPSGWTSSSRFTVSRRNEQEANCGRKEGHARVSSRRIDISSNKINGSAGNGCRDGRNQGRKGESRRCCRTSEANREARTSIQSR